MDARKLRQTIGYVRPLARRIDTLIGQRLSWLLKGPFLRVAALGCILLALTVPRLEIAPFAGVVSWAAIRAFGLAIIARDGILALVALGFAIGAGVVVGWTLL